MLCAEKVLFRCFDCCAQLQQCQQDHRDEVERFTTELDDEMDSRCNLEKTLADLRKEVISRRASTSSDGLFTLDMNLHDMN